MEKNEEIQTIKQALKHMKEFVETGNNEHITDARLFGEYVVKVLEGLAYKVEELEREIGPSTAFIDPNSAPHRLR